MKAKGNGEGGKSDRDSKKRVMAWKRAMVRAARAMVTATRAAGDDESEGVEEGNKDKEGHGDGDVGGGWRVTKRAMATAAEAMATVAEAMATDTDVNKCRFFHSGVN